MTSTTNPVARREELVRLRLAGRSAGRSRQIPPADRSRPLPLSFGQQQMWFLNRWEADSAEYLVPLALTLRGPLDVAALDGAWQAVLRRHEILRTRYELVDGEPAQLIDAPRPVPLPVVDLTGLTDDERARRVARIVATQSTTGFDLAVQWPVRAQLLQLGLAEHVFVVVFHHIACDAWSMNVFAQDLSEFYRALTRPGVPTPTPLPVQYADYAAWQRAELAGPALERHLDYWRAQLAGVATLDLPTDRPRPAVRDWHGSSVRFQLSDELAAGLRALADKADVTLFVALLAAFQALLSRYTGSTDIPVGTVVSGRGRAELRGLIGYGINTLVLRGRWTGDPHFSDLLHAAKATVLDGFDHQETPFAQLVSELQPERDLSRTPLYQVAFTMHEDPAGLPGLSDVETIPVESPWRISKVDLTLHIQTGGDGSLRGQLEYATALFDEATVARMVGHLIRLLEHATVDPRVRLSELDILDRSELPLLLETGAVACPVDRRVHELFAARAAGTPDAVAVVFEGESLTYADLDARANRLAHHLRSRGAGPETVVGVCLERGPDLIPTLLGVLKSGAAYLPLDPAQPVDRLRFMLADAAAPLVVTRADQRELLGGYGGEVVLLDQADLAAEPSTDPQAEGHPDNAIYMIYTSGSTGRPKGVCLTHANVVRLLAVAEPFYTFGPDDVWPLLHSYAFDVSVWEMWGALLNGGRLVVVPAAVIRAPDELLDLLVAHRVTILNQTPTAFRGLVDLAAAGDPRVDRLALRAVVFAGEKLDYPDLRPWTDRLGLAAPALLNMYGITETTVHSTLHQVRAADLDPGAPNQVGRALPDLRIHLLDPHGRLVPVGVVGEIHVGGAGVARGYLNRPELTAQRFVPDPFGAPGQRLYRSGDLARRLPDGTLEFRGRIDDQVKIRGYRIELGEIEAAMAAVPGIRDAVVVVREDTPGDRRLVGYGVLGNGPAPAPAEIRAALARTLPEYMVPSAFVALSAIPLTANGKLDKRALPSPDRSALAARDSFVAPRDAVEEALAAIWREVLRVDRVGVDDSFFDLGGDSIRAVALVGALREARYDVTVRDIFELRTVAQLGQFVAGRDEATGATPVVEAFALIGDVDRAKLPAAVVDAYPLSQVQAGMLVEMLTNDTEHNYHNVTSFRIRDERPFSIDALRAAAAVVVSRHEVLRTGFDLVSYSQPVQLVYREALMPVGHQDLTGADEDAVREALAEHSRRERATLFDLGTPTLLRVFAHVCADAWWLSVTECHAVLEGWSHHSLLMELLDVYRGIRDGETAQPYVAPAVRYADFIAAELAALESTEDRQYWRDIAAGYPRFVLPAGLGAGPRAPREIHVHAVPFHDLRSGLHALATLAQVSIKSVLVAAHLKVMSQLTDAPEFSMGLVCDARPELSGAERVYGMYLNTVPFAHDRSAGTWRELVRQVFAREVELWPHRRFPLPAIQREAGGGRLFDVYFNYQDFNQVDEDIVDYRASIDDSPTEFPLTVSSREGLFLLSADTRALSRHHIGRIGDMYRAVVEAMVADIDGDAQPTYLPVGEREWLLGRTPVKTEPTRCVHEVFAVQAAATPDAVAVVFEDVVLSYAAVNGRANRLAHHLVGLGVGPECLVGVCLDRGADLVPVLLGVLKSGGAYLPVEPGLPDDRVGFMLADAGVRVLVTSSAYADRLAGLFDGVLVVVDRDREALATRSDADPVVGVRPEQLMYVIYTSGSTGQPKGVCVTHANVLRLLMVGDQHYHFRADDVWPLFHSYAFDVSVWELWGSLLYGGRLVVVPRDVQRSPEDFLDLLIAHRVTVLNQTPSAFRGLVGLARDGDPRIDRLALRAVVFAGEKLELGELAPWVARRGLDAPELFNMYGITETTVHTTFHRVVEGDLTDGGNPVGHPLADLTVHLLDQGGHLVPVGVPGEVYVGGPGVARGYANRPGLTAQRFVPDPFGAVGERLYRSGDVARRLVDGSLEFLGRLDDQVKVRGFRVELGEISAVLGGHPGVRDVVVVVREDVPGDRRLVAYCVPESGVAPGDVASAGQLAAYCAVRLPAYMVPSAFVSLAALPLTTNGKLDRRALPSPERDSLLAARAYVAPRTPVEARLVEVWRDVLGVARVGVEDSFFDLGGDSIRAVSLVGAVRAAGFDIAVRDVFAYQSVAEIAELVTGRPAPETPIAPVAAYALLSEMDRAAVPEGVVDAYPLSQGQLGMLIEMLTTEGQHAYHNVNSFLIPDDEPVDLSALTEAARIVAARHDVLRTSMELTGYSVPIQLVHAAADIPVTGHDLRGLDPRAQRQAVGDAIAHERATLFDLSTAPLLRITVHLLTERSWRMTFTQSHTITEGWSYHSFLMELLDAYRAVRAGVEAEPAVAPWPAVRYADFVAAELESLASEADRAYWRDIVAGHPRLRLPERWHDGPGTPREPMRGGVFLGPYESGLRALATGARASMKAVLLAAHLKVMSQLTEESAFSVGLVCDARPEVAGAERVYGMHLNTLPFAHDRGAATWRELVRQVFAREVELWPHRRFPLPAIQRETGGERLIDVIFTYLDFHIVDGERVDLDSTISDSPTEFPLSVATLGGYLGLSSNTEVFNRTNMNRLSSMYEAVIAAMASDLDGDARASFLPDGERSRLIEAAWAPNRSAAVARTRPVHELFEHQAAATPQAVAVVADGVPVTYAELNVRANRLAHHLRALGVGPDRLVGVCLDRGVELVVSLLAVLKAGGAYLPLDPAYPAERRDFMLADAGAPWLITQAEYTDLLPTEHGYALILVDAHASVVATRPAHDPTPVATVDNLIYVIYTSGSTGQPKGVCLTHANVHRLFTVTQDQFGFGPADVWTLFHSYAFDFSVWELWGPLLHGGTLVVVPAAVARSPEDFLDLLVRERVTILNQTPSAFRALVTAAGEGDPRIDQLALRAVVFGGERLELAEIAPWVARLGLDRPELINMYGITETTVHVTHRRLDAVDLATAGVSPVGDPLADLCVHLLDRDGYLVPFGVSGEIHVGGAGVARSYLNRPGLTAERFVPDPFGAPGTRLYRSGDLARRELDGGLTFLGLADDQVKIRGYRIELGEIAAALTDQSGVRSAVVVVRERSLIGYVVASGETAPAPAELRAALARVLPDYMVPAAIVAIPRIPLTATGKLDQRALPVPGLAALGSQATYVAPATRTQRGLAEVWAQVLSLTRVGIHDAFFDLGGDSLRAITLVGAMRAAGYEVGVRDVFVHQSVDALARFIDDRDGIEPVPAFTPVAPYALITAADRDRLPTGVVDAYPASQAQIGMAVEMVNATDRALYHITSSFRIRDDQPFSAPALHAAVTTLVSRHETLRTSVDLANYSVPMQVVHAEAAAEVRVHAGTAGHLAYVEAQRDAPFDLERSPLLRVGAHTDGVDSWWLTLTVSHLITGGWDFNSLLMELVDGYRRHRDGQPAPAQDVPPVRFADFIAAELESLESTVDQAYWRGIGAGFTPYVLPTGWGDPGSPESYLVRVGYHDLDPALRALASSAGVSVKAVLHAAHLKVMSQLTDEERFHTGLICDSRPEVAGAELVHGMYINTLPFAHERGAATWRDLVRQVFAREVELWPHRRFPLPAVQRVMGTGGHPVQVIFDFMDYHQVDSSTVDVEASVGEGSTEFGLVVGTVGGFVTLTTNTGLISRDNAERLLAMYRAVLVAMAADPRGDARAAYLPDGERGRLLAAAGTGELPEATRCVHEVFAAQAAATPDAVAVVCGEVALSYGTVDGWANGLAHRLVGLGVGPECLVGVCLDRGVDLVPVLLGVLKSGGAYLPVEPGLPDDRVGFMLADAGVRVLVTSSAYADRLAGLFDGVSLVVDEGEGLQGGSRVDGPAVGVGLDHVMYVMYTSGSTGQPKGVCATHRNVERFMTAAHRRYGFRADDVWPLFHSYAFDVSVWESFGALLYGGALIVVPEAARRSPEDFLDLLVAHRVTVLNQTPSAFRGLVGLARDGDPRIDRLALRMVMIAGEKPDLGELAPWVARRGLDAPELFNMYGITETTVESMTHRIRAEDLAVAGANPVGHPFDGSRVHLLDRDGYLVPVSVPGEVYIGGPGVARGYLNRPELTAQRFVPDPFDATGGRLYRSGDVARRLADGSLEFLGRLDDQVKVRGFRVELGEITAVLGGHPDVRDVVVVVREDVPGDRRLVAYCVPESDVLASAGQLAEYCAVRLPPYMVPAAFVMLDAFPLAGTGKLDKRALPAPDRDALGTAHAYVAPRNPAEARVAAVWQKVLGVAQVGVEDNFFDLGGDSIRAVSLVGALRAAGLGTTVRDVFALRTVAGLAASVTVGAPDSAPATVAPFALLSEVDRAALPDGLVDAYPAAQTQLGMLVELLASDNGAAYHSVISHGIRDATPLHAAAFTAAVRTVVDRHEVLRTSFELTGFSVPMQLVHARVDPVVRVVDGRAMPAAEQAAALEEYLAAERATPFELDAAPLMRVAAHVGDDESWWLTFTLCHAITEGWSIALLREEVLDVYRRLRDNVPIEPAAAPPVRYADFVAGELQALASTQDREYWQGIVERHPKLRLPAGWGEAAPRQPIRVGVDFRELAAPLRALASATRVSLKAVLLAAHLKVQSQLTEEETFHTGLVCDVRPEVAGADRLHGMFLNTVPFAHDRSARTWRELIGQVFDREVELSPHRRYPLPAIQRGARQRLIDVLFNYQDFGGAAVAEHAGDAAGAATVEVTMGEGSTEFALSVIAGDGHLDLLTHSEALTRSNVDRLAQMYHAVFAAMVADPDGDAQAPCLPAGERERLLGGRDDTLAMPVTRRVHELFEEQVARTPDAVAVSWGGVDLTYRDLNARANRLAHHLRSQGAGPERLVGVCLERGPDLVPTLLGVLKSGAAYLPLDPAQPAQRLRFMLADAGVRLVVTTSSLRPLMESYGGQVIALDGTDLSGLPESDPGTDGAPDNLIYVIYTSGSTGRPKGVSLTHANVARLFTAAREHYAFDETDVWILLHSYAFDVSVWELWGALLHGGRLVVVPQSVIRSPEDLLDVLVAERVSVLNQTPSAFRGLLHLAATGDPRVDRLALRAVVFAGEKLELAELAPWAARLGLGRVALVNMYGITETTVHSTYHRVAREHLRPGAGNAIGRPLSDLSVHLLDGRGQLVPVGVVGEIHVGGAGVARGYVNRPELTAARFVPDPFGPPGARLYRSGDLARRLPDGSLEFCGRLDDQVKIRGYRVELGEIEAALTAIDGIRQAVVILSEDSARRQLVAYCVPDGEAPAPAQLRAALSRGLPEYMVPAAFVMMAELPLTTNGKLDKRALPSPDDDASARQEYVAPATATERLLAGLWARLLGVNQVGTKDRFLELGGDSIGILRLKAEAQARDLVLPLSLLYQNLTLAELAAALTPDASFNTTAGGPTIPSPLPTMAAHHVPGAVIALLDRGEVVDLRAYGRLAHGGPDPVTTEAAFQVGSVSKLVSALGALRLVDQGRLALDADINDHLTSWRVPGGAVITLRQLLGHLSGLTPVTASVYRPGQAVPDLLDLLLGRAPVETPPIEVEFAPGTVFRNADVHYAVLQQLMEDRCGTPFPALMRELLLDPLGMTGSGYEHTIGGGGRPVALGHTAAGDPVPGGWTIRPDVAAAGLWATAADLARVVQEIRAAHLGQGPTVLSPELARQMLTEHPGSLYGLGSIVDGSGPDLEFGHGGETAGYRAMVFSRLRSGQGVVVLTNGAAGREVATFLATALGGGDAI